MRLRFTLLLLMVGLTTAYAQQRLNISPDLKTKKTKQVKTTDNNPVIAARPRGVSLSSHCGFESYMKLAKSRGYDEGRYETALNTLIKKRIAGGKTAFTGTVIIPVIFHSIYRTGDALSDTTANLTAARYRTQIDQMNLDYANLSGSAYGVSADVRIRFCLAVVDTAGRVLAEPGIDRINGTTRVWTNTDGLNINQLESYFESTIKPQSIWDPSNYFNVWTAAMTNSGLLGYSTFPALSTLDGLDNTETNSNAGCVIAWETVGSVASPGIGAPYGFGRTLTHESGHFFGLRHIWGDEDCGNDFCADTPPQKQETTGCPATGTLNNCTPSMAKMFENYMDYSNDACLNTFTADQALRCQASVDNSPRRLSLLSSKACQARASNAIQFANSSVVLSETGNAGSCPNVKTYTFSVYVSLQATGNATINFTKLSGTATNNADYTITPASASFIAGDNSPKTITLTIIDDQEAEPTETLVIGYTITGSGVVAGPDKQQLQIAILDDDIAGTTVDNSAPSKTLLNENFDAKDSIPSGWSAEVYDDGVGGYTPNQWVVSNHGGAGTVSNAAHITNNLSTKPNQYTRTNISDAYLITPLLDATGLRNLNFAFKWRSNGEVGYDEGYIGYIPEGTAVSGANVIYFDAVFSGRTAGSGSAVANLTLPAALSNTKFHLVFNWFNDDVLGSNPPFTVDSVVVTGSNFAVASAAGADTAFSQFNGQTVSYYSKSGGTSNIIATVSDVTENIGCLTATVKQAGTGRTALNTNNASYFRTDKVITLTPAVAHDGAVYGAILYYTNNELSPAWSSADIPNLKILKVKEGVDIYGIINPADAEVITPTFEDHSAQGYYSYKGSFTGFSQFMLVSPNIVLPVKLINFYATAKKTSILLNWATEQELNSKGFKVERSIDGINFSSIGWVDAKVNSSTQTNYSFSDNYVQPNTVYYYRLRQVDANNKEDISTIRQAKINKAGLAVTISPVPAKDVLNVFISGGDKAADMKLMNAQGQVLRTWNHVNVSGANALNVSGLPAGVYLLNIVLADENIVKKVLIEK